MGDSQALDLREKPKYEAPRVEELEEGLIEKLGEEAETFLRQTVQA
ncbi:MAG TPA: hypothetical protein VM600_10485 [Actinomycetota bacterium]|nr:hypothetical protein [Actinomycetota bacterium]